MKILFIEGKCSAAPLIQELLDKNKIKCDICTLNDAFDVGSLGESLDKLFLFCRYDVVLVDFRSLTSGMDRLLEHIKNSKTEALILADRSEFQARMADVSDGGLHFITRSYNGADLINQVRFLGQSKDKGTNNVITVGSLQLNTYYKTVEAYGSTLKLTNREYRIMELMFRNHGVTLEKEFFLSRLYEKGECPDDKIIDVFVCKIRKKLEDILGPIGKNYIETIWGKGYVMREPHLQNTPTTATALENRDVAPPHVACVY